MTQPPALPPVRAVFRAAGLRIWVVVLQLFDLSTRLATDVGVFGLMRVFLWTIQRIEHLVPVTGAAAALIVRFHSYVAGLTYAVLALFGAIDIIHWRRGQ